MMCGINGVFHYRNEGPPDPALLERQMRAQRHRGPDDAGLWCEGPAGLGHQRLAVVDLSAGGHQPMPNEDQTIWLTFNGEIYNWPELKGTLAARGHQFRGNCDAEMLLHLYEEHGDALLEHLRGMFAFGLYDQRRRRLLLARDRLGEKPLYYHDDGCRLAFASELKALMLDLTIPREVDERALAEYLAFQYVPSPRTIFKGVYKLPPAHALVCDAGGVRVWRYWSLPVEPDEGHPAEYYSERLRALLEEAVQIELRSDVPLGAFLSGGVDSGAVVALMSQLVREPIKTFSIGFEEEGYSELEEARRVARHLGTDHHELVLHSNALELLPRLVWQLDEPFADASMIPTFCVAEMARHHVTVALSGDGGDEAFAGYAAYGMARRHAAFDRIPAALRRLAGEPARLLPPDHPLGRRLRRAALSPVDRHFEVMACFPPLVLSTLLGEDLRAALSGHDPFAAARGVHVQSAKTLGDAPALLYLDAMTYMADDVLVKVDRTSMLSSLEVRAPLLDHKLLEFIARIPFEYKLRGKVSKWIFKRSVRDLLPPETLKRGKRGFSVPLDRWFDGALGRLSREVLLDSRARRRGWFDPRAVSHLLDSAGRRNGHRAHRAFALVCLELWAQAFLDCPPDPLDGPCGAAAALHPVVRAAGTHSAGSFLVTCNQLRPLRTP